MDIKKKKIAVIGTGSAGIQTLSHFLAWADGLVFEIVSIHDPKIPILGIGESTNPVFLKTLQYGLNFNLTDDMDKLDATYKFNSRFENWRSHNFNIPLFVGDIAIHFDTHSLANFALPRFKEIWGDKFSEVIGSVSSYEEKDDFVSVIIDDVEHQFDYLIDCRGFPKTYENYEILPFQTVNHCLVHNVDEPDNKFSWGHTVHRATKDGWMFGIPLQSRKSYGYLFNDKITSVEDARNNFSEELNIPKEELQNIEYTFLSYRAKKITSKRVFMNGCRAVFFEPLFANSLWLYNEINLGIYKIICEGIDSNYIDEGIRRNVIPRVAEIISYVYHGGSNFDTDFWKKIVPITTDVIESSDSLYRARNKMRYMDSHKFYEPFVFVFDEKHLKMIDSDNCFGYNHFKSIDYRDIVKK